MKFFSLCYLFSKRSASTVKCVALFYFAIVLSSCGGRYVPKEPVTEKSATCSNADKKYNYDELSYSGSKQGSKLSFNDVRDGINSACMNCHQAPANSGGFTYIDSYQSEERTINGVTAVYPGFFETAEKMSAYIFHTDESQRMPPAERRNKNPQSFINIGVKLNAWITARKPNGSFNLDASTPNENSTFVGPRQKRDELGDCTPVAAIAGFDFGIDRKFEKMTELPRDLSDTDIFSLDAYQLAKKGTFAYNVEYPLWADNSDKGRWVHVPMKLVDGKLIKQSIGFDSKTNQFIIPANTRFYKNFYKKYIGVDQLPHYRRIETRVIVTRGENIPPLFGSYKWDASETTATLVETPYRDGSSFKDTLFDVTIDDIKKKTRTYAIPGRHRCMNCHIGAENNSFVLGFSPLQINRRSTNDLASGRDGIVQPHELNQVDRLISYGVISNINSTSDLPKLETLGSTAPKNEFELKAQGYFVGNCAHCHNSNGIAFSKENGVTLKLTAGSIFGMSTQVRSTQIPSRAIVHHLGDLDQSHIWRKINDSNAQLGLTSQMPMDTPGGPDCKALRVVGKWIRSFESLQAANDFEPVCKSQNEFKWIDQDFTVVSSEYYTPRRPDWKDISSGMPEKYRNITLTPELSQAMNKEYAVGYWSKKEICQFPEKDIPVEDRRPWMMKGAKPKRPFGEVYYTTPGSWYYRTSCMKCHGAKADGDSALAKGILNWSGGGVRVADLIHGMFGNKGENLKTFVQNGMNYSPNYLIWMAVEGTRVKFPPELSGFLGKHGGQMLNQMREKCLNQISPEKPSSPQFMDHEIFEKICFVNNKTKQDLDLAYDEQTGTPKNPSAVEAWADRAAWNIGFSIHQFLLDTAKEVVRPGNDQCELLFKKKENP